MKINKKKALLSMTLTALLTSATLIANAVDVETYDTNNTVIVNAVDQLMFVQVEVTDITQVKGIKCNKNAEFKDPNIEYAIEDNTIEMFGQSAGSDGYVYIQLMDDTVYKIELN